MSACKKDEEIVMDAGYDYFPMTKGAYVVYEVDSIVKDDPVNVDTVYKFLLKEKIDCVYYDMEGRLAARIERYKKPFNPQINYDSMQWVITDVWWSVRTERFAEKSEENIPFRKLSFPVRADAKWNGNAANVLQEREYKYTSIHIPETINAVYLDSVLSVEQINESNLIETKYSVEKFAKHVGLVYKKEMFLTIQPAFSGEPPPFSDTVASAYYTMKIISYGK